MWLVIADSSNSMIASLDLGLEIEFTLKSIIPKKHSQGGQSQMRFQRIRREAIARHFKILSNELVKLTHNLQYKIIIGGNTVNLDKFSNLIKSIPNLQDKIFARHIITYNGESGMRELIKKAEKSLVNIQYLKETKIINGFIDLFYKNPDRFKIGQEECSPLLMSNKYKKALILKSYFDKIKPKLEKIDKLNIIEIDSEETYFVRNTCGGIMVQVQ